MALTPCASQAEETAAQGGKYRGNSISTTKYNLVTYFPKARWWLPECRAFRHAPTQNLRYSLGACAAGALARWRRTHDPPPPRWQHRAVRQHSQHNASSV